jgi:hypothetical protein
MEYWIAVFGINAVILALVSRSRWLIKDVAGVRLIEAGAVAWPVKMKSTADFR